MGGGGGDFFEEVRKNPVGTIANVGANFMTGGLVGFEDGKATKGVLTHAADEAVGEITGRNMMRKAMMDQKDALAESKKQGEIDDANLLSRRRDQDVLASRAAAIGKRRGSLGLGGDNLNPDTLGV